MRYLTTIQVCKTIASKFHGCLSVGETFHWANVILCKFPGASEGNKVPMTAGVPFHACDSIGAVVHVWVDLRVLCTSKVPHVCPSSGTLECHSYWIPTFVSAKGADDSVNGFVMCVCVHHQLWFSAWERRGDVPCCRTSHPLPCCPTPLCTSHLYKTQNKSVPMW